MTCHDCGGAMDEHLDPADPVLGATCPRCNAYWAVFFAADEHVGGELAGELAARAVAEVARVLAVDAPAFDVPFSLTAEKRKERKGIQPALFE